MTHTHRPMPGSEKPDTPAPTKRTPSWLAILRHRCPRCRQGKLFRTWLTMYDACPVCGLRFEREPGYYVGALYFGYALGIAILIPLYFLLAWLLPRVSHLVLPLIAIGLYVPFAPIVFRYSRTLWIHFERYFSPEDVSSYRG